MKINVVDEEEEETSFIETLAVFVGVELFEQLLTNLCVYSFEAFNLVRVAVILTPFINMVTK